MCNLLHFGSWHFCFSRRFLEHCLVANPPFGLVFADRNLVRYASDPHVAEHSDHLDQGDRTHFCSLTPIVAEFLNCSFVVDELGTLVVSAKEK